MGDGSRDDRTVYVRNLDNNVSEEILFELFLQAGPLVGVKRPKDQDGSLRPFAFVEFEHDVSPPYARSLMDGLKLFTRNIGVQFRSGSKHNNQDSRGNSPSSTPPYNKRSGGHTPAPNGLQSYPTPPLIQRAISAPQGLFVLPSGQMPNNLIMDNFPPSNLFPVDRQQQQFHQMQYGGQLGMQVGQQRAHQRQDYPDISSSSPHRRSSHDQRRSYQSQEGSEEERSSRSHRHDDRHYGHSSSSSSRHEQHNVSEWRQPSDDRRHGSLQRHQSHQHHRDDRRDHPYRR